MCPSDSDDEFAYHPDMRPKGTGLQCFMNGDRVCGADCMAFQTDRPEGPDYQDQWAHCMLLTNLHRGAKHLVVLTQSVNTIVRQGQDMARQNQVPPGIPIPGVR